MNLSLFTSRDYPRAIVTHARQRSLDRRSMSRCTWRSRQTKICGIVGYQLITLIFGSRHVAVSRYRGIYRDRAFLHGCVRVSSRTRVLRSRIAVFGRPPPLPVATAADRSLIFGVVERIAREILCFELRSRDRDPGTRFNSMRKLRASDFVVFGKLDNYRTKSSLLNLLIFFC